MYYSKNTWLAQDYSIREREREMKLSNDHMQPITSKKDAE